MSEQQNLQSLIPSEQDAVEALSMLAHKLCKNDLLPKEYRGQPGNVFAALQLARELGMGPMTLMRGTYFIGGRPAFDAATVGSLLRRSGQIKGAIRYEEDEQDGGRARAVVHDLFDHEVAGPWVSMKMAQADGWTRNAKYKTLPAAMLRRRALTWLVRESFPEVLSGFHTSEEIEDAVASGQLAPREVELEQGPDLNVQAGLVEPPQAAEPEPTESDTMEWTDAAPPKRGRITEQEIPF